MIYPQTQQIQRGKERADCGVTGLVPVLALLLKSVHAFYLPSL